MAAEPSPTLSLLDATYPRLRAFAPTVAVLPWGATEAHGGHLPHGTDVYEASAIAARAAELAHLQGARPVVLPTIPFGNDEQQLDQVATISITTPTAAALLRDVVHSLLRQRIFRLAILNGHGGNEFKPIVRDIFGAHPEMRMVVMNFWQLAQYPHDPRVAHNPGDHADEMETSLMLHVAPHLVRLEDRGDGRRQATWVDAITRPGAWTPRPWSLCHPDTGSGDASYASPEKGRAFFDQVTAAAADVIVALARAT